MLATMATMASNHYISSGSATVAAKPVVQLSSLRSSAQAGIKSMSKAAKRRSAVERLEASKANYVKSEKVLDAKQELRHSNHLRISSTTPSIETLKNTWKLWAQPNNSHPKMCHRNGTMINGYHTLHANRPSCHALPPKSPGLSRAKSKPDCATHTHIKRKEDFQFKLRQLISSRDNSSESDYSHRSRDCPIIQARAQQDVDYNLHKSMPDLNQVRPCIDPNDCARSATNSSSYDNAQKTLSRSHRATSDYVSRSSSCKQECMLDESLSSDVLHTTSAVEDDPLPACLTQLSKRRPILRSKSDISYRYSKEPYNESVKKVQKCSPELERFFDSMGLDVTELSNLSRRDVLSPSRFFNSVSSIDSDERRESIMGEEDDVSDVNTCGRSGLRNSDLLRKNGPTETSIIERNARIIKWLYNCRKSLEVSK